ncbi:unannotated protein [freshwater metagenome]|uniref:Unannotated protein n=1 Tax=freshwater metagenome TaxID=449393 RepID=A0A6J6LTK0_9ZZZZ
MVSDRNDASSPVVTTSRRSHTGAWVVAVILILVYALPLRGLLRSQGPPMEEGFMLAFPEFVLNGLRPNRDFLHLYGPGSLWALAGTYKLFGVSLAAERWFGVLQQVGIIAGVAGLARYWGRLMALTAGLVAIAFVIPPIGLTALAWDGAVALLVLGLLCALEGRRRIQNAATALKFSFSAGLLLGLGLTFRPDLVIAATLGGCCASWGLGNKFFKRMIAGAAIGVSPYILHLFLSGPMNIIRGMVLDPVFKLRGGRGLPIPPSWSQFDSVLQRVGAEQLPRWPAPISSPAQLALWFWVLIFSVFFILGVSIWSIRRERARFNARALLAIGALSLGMLPQAIQRADSAHLSWVSCVPLAFLPIAVLELNHLLRPKANNRRGVTLAIATAALLLFAVTPHFTARIYADYTAQSFGYRRTAVPITHHGRLFYYGRPEVQGAAESLLARIDSISKPGDRLFVGTADLRRTPYSDAYLYYLLPWLTPATYFVEMDPGMANAEDSRMPSDLASADVVVLSSIWRDWSEPNTSVDFGSLKSTKVLVRDFCLDNSFGGGIYELYTRRPKPGACPTGTTPPTLPPLEG